MFVRRALSRPAIRCYSTAPSSTSTSTAKKAATRPPPSSSPSNPITTKNIKLNPAPVKPATLSSSQPKNLSTPKSKSTGKQTAQAKDAAAPPVYPVLAEDKSPSPWNLVQRFQFIKQQTLDDLEAAYKDGTFPPRPVDATWWRSTFHTVWELAKFYLRGVRLIFVRQRDSFRIRRRISQHSGPPLARSEFRMILTQKHDVRKVVPFAIVALIVEEAIPFIAILAPSALPSTCLLPRQLERIALRKDRLAFNAFRSNLPLLHQLVESSAESSFETLLRKNRQANPVLCSIYRLPTLGGNFLRRRRLSQHLRFLEKDDELLRREQAGAKLSPPELDQALRERGFLLSQIPARERLQRLEQYLHKVDPSKGESQRLAVLL